MKNRSHAHSAHATHTAHAPKKKAEQTSNPHSRSVLWAVLTLIVTAVLMFSVGEGTGNGSVAYVVSGLVMVLACYSIVKQNPASAWYVPVLVNLLGIISALIEPNFWKTDMWMYNTAIWALSAVACVVGAMQGKKVKS